ncbi:hypothetical protein V7S43_009956 [Phytophthora oleae]|uniref:Uncharacterized protein n=1 Tax=Phytophthora oleae TaxID=2107226 RepID=A0ABD3FEE2_9STRA
MALALDAKIISEFLSSYDFSELSSLQLENGFSSESASEEKQATGARHKVYRKRCRVEQRQRRLYAAVSAQSALIHQYQGLIQGAPVHDGISPLRIDRHYQHKKLRVESFDTAFFKASFDTVGAIYAQTDETFEKVSIDATHDNCATFTQAMASESGSTHFQYLDKRKFPACFTQTCSTVVRSIDVHQKNDQQMYDGMERHSSAYKFRVSTRLESGQNASVLLRVINRRYHEDCRMVTIWRAFAEGEGAFLGLHADEIGWAVLTPSIEADGSSLMRRFARYVPMNFHSVEEAEDAVTKLFSKMVIDASTQNSEDLACRVDKWLRNDEQFGR